MYGFCNNRSSCGTKSNTPMTSTGLVAHATLHFVLWMAAVDVHLWVLQTTHQCYDCLAIRQVVLRENTTISNSHLSPSLSVPVTATVEAQENAFIAVWNGIDTSQRESLHCSWKPFLGLSTIRKRRIFCWARSIVFWGETSARVKMRQEVSMRWWIFFAMLHSPVSGKWRYCRQYLTHGRKRWNLFQCRQCHVGFRF